MVQKKFILEKDIHVFCVEAKSFPNGIIEAFQTLQNLNVSICERPFYGISYQNKEGRTIYKAAVAEAYAGEGKKYKCETFVIRSGEYLTITLLNFMKNLEVIPNAFQELLSNPAMDQSFPCLEWYKSNVELMCMVRLKIN